MTVQVASALLQAHEGFLGESLATGLSTAKASVFLTSNHIEHEKLEGRLQRITFDECEFSVSHKSVLKDQLLPLAEENKGYLIAWCCLYKELYLSAEKSVHDQLHRLIRKFARGHQMRLTASLANTLIVYCLLHITSEMYIDILQIFEKMIIDSVSNKIAPFIERFSANLKEELPESNETLTWLNPCCKFKKDGKTYPCIAIRVEKFKSFTDIASFEVSSFLKDYGETAYMATALFARDVTVDLKEINKKTKSRSLRCHKFPWADLPVDLQNAIKEKVGMVGISTDVRTDADFEDSSEERTDEVGGNLGLDEKVELFDVIRKLKNLYQVMFGETSRAELNAQHLPASNKRSYQSMSMSEREVFRLGYATALKEQNKKNVMRAYDSE